MRTRDAEGEDVKAWASSNKTELYQACCSANLRVSPAKSRKELIQLLVEGEEADENPFDPWRDRIMKFLLDHWKKVRVQLTCPASSGDVHACYQCTDTQVVACLLQNPDMQRRL